LALAMLPGAAWGQTSDATTTDDAATDPTMTGQVDGACSVGARSTRKVGALGWLLGLAALGLRQRRRRGA